MASSTLFRRISSSQIFRSARLVANRLITGGVTPPKSPPVPWLMLQPQFDGEDELIFRFQCAAKSKIYVLFSQINLNPEFVGSSHGWLALYDEKKRDVFLSDPITRRHIKLPPLDTAMWELDRVTLDGREGKAFVIFGAGQRLAFCNPQRSHAWTVFGGDEAYESVVYSSSHRRLLCITSTFKLEAWDVDREFPRLDWATQFESPDPDRQPELKRVIYLVCADEQVFVVVRHMNPGGGFWSRVGVDGDFMGPTVGFEVYKIDGGLLKKMKESLEGLTMFVGMNHPFAVKDAAVGLEPNAIYFGFDKRVKERRDHGIFDYEKGAVSRRWNFPQPFYDVSDPIWFVPHTI